MGIHCFMKENYGGTEIWVRLTLSYYWFKTTICTEGDRWIGETIKWDNLNNLWFKGHTSHFDHDSDHLILIIKSADVIEWGLIESLAGVVYNHKYTYIHDVIEHLMSYMNSSYVRFITQWHTDQHPQHCTPFIIG